MMAHVAEGFVKPFADLPQFQSFKIKQLQRLPLYERELFERTLQMREVELHSHFVLDIRAAHKSIAHRVDICTSIEPPARQMSLTIPGPAESDLHYPAFGAPLGA